MQQMPKGEFSRLLQKLFGLRGNIPVSVNSSVTPVVIVENAVAGPYLPFRAWHTGQSIGGVAAQFTQTHVRYVPGASQLGHVVVDYMLLAASQAGGIWVTLAPAAAAPFANEAFAADRDLAAGGGVSALLGEIQIPDVRQGSFVGAAGFVSSTQTFPIGTAPLRIDGPWVLRAGDALVIRHSAAQTDFRAYFSGRLYEAS